MLPVHYSSVVMKYFVSEKFRLFKKMKATKGPAWHEYSAVIFRLFLLQGRAGPLVACMECHVLFE